MRDSKKERSIKFSDAMKTFEDLPVYHKAKELCISIYKFDNNKYQKDFGFKDQIQRASISVLNNIAEGFERGSDRDFIKFLYYSKRIGRRNQKFIKHCDRIELH